MPLVQSLVSLRFPASQSAAAAKFRVLPRAAAESVALSAGKSFALKRLAYVLELVGSGIVMAAFLILAILA